MNKLSQVCKTALMWEEST